VTRLFTVRMDVALPPDVDPAERGDLRSSGSHPKRSVALVFT
jgi:hypothetical protein